MGLPPDSFHEAFPPSETAPSLQVCLPGKVNQFQLGPSPQALPGFTYTVFLDRVSCSNEAYPVFLGLPGILADPDISGVYLGRPDCLMKIFILGLCKRVRKRLRNHPGACEHNRPEVGSNVDGFSRPPSPPSRPIPAILSQKLLRRATV